MSNKKYYWLKLKEDFFEEDTIAWLEEQENGKEYALFYLKLCLKSLKTNGYLIRNVGQLLIPYDTKKLAEITNTDFDTAIVAMELLKKIGLVEVLENGEIYLTQLANMVGSETSKAAIMRKSRAKKTTESVGGNIVTPMLPEQSNNVDTEIENRDRDKEIEKENRDKEKDATALQNDNVKKKSKAKSSKNDYSIFEEFAGSDNSLLETLKDFSEMRKSIKKPMTDRAMKKLLTDLKKISEDPVVQIQVLEQSIFNNWQGVYPLKNNERGFDNGRSENGNGETGGQNGSNFNFGVYL